MVTSGNHPNKQIKIQQSNVYGAKKDGTLRVVEDFGELNAASHEDRQ
jgi:hypothetical protein